MCASWSRPISSPRNICAITSANRRTHGQRSPDGLDHAAAVASRAVSWLDRAADAGAGGRLGVATAVGQHLPAFLSSLVLSHPRAEGAPDRSAERRTPG